MPQVLVLVVVGAGLYSGYKWVSREVLKAQAAAERATETMRQRANEARHGAPIDLGALEWDAALGVYRPKG